MKKKFRYIGFMLIISILFSFCTTANASEETFYSKYLIVSQSGVEEINYGEYMTRSASTVMFTNNDLSSIAYPVILPFSQRETSENTTTTITLSNIAANIPSQDINARANVADYILSCLGYEADFINGLPIETRLKFISSGLEIESTTSYVVTSGGNTVYYPASKSDFVNTLASGINLSANNSSSDVTTESSVAKTTLTYARTGPNSCYLTLYSDLMTTTGYITGKTYSSICVQNSSIVTGSSSLQHKYDYRINGVPGNYNHTFTESDSNYDSAAGSGTGGGTGVVYEAPRPVSDQTFQYYNISYFLECDVENSSVNPGGAFNIYGNFATQNTFSIGSPSISFPWGISFSPSTAYTNHKTQLTEYYD